MADSPLVFVRRLMALRPSPVQMSHLSEGQSTGAVQFAAWATEHAEALHERFPDVLVQVGLMSFPQCRLARSVDFDERFGRLPQVDPSLAIFALDGPLSVPSGQTGRHHLLVTNMSEEPVSISTNGQVTAHVVDATTRKVVGVATEAQLLPGVRFNAASGTTVRVPLLVGTASVSPDLGYSVPPGRWLAQGLLRIQRQDFRTPPLSFAVVPADQPAS